MVRKHEIVTVNHTKLPSIVEACNLLHEMVKRNIDFAPRKVDKPLILYGAGNLGKMAKQYFDKLNIPFLFVIDKNYDRYKDDTFWRGIEILSPENIPIQIKQHSLLAICIVNHPYSEVGTQLITEGWNDIVPFYDITNAYTDKHPLNNGWHTRLTNTDIDNMKNVLRKLEDDTSCAHYLQFIAWHCLREEWIFKDAPITIEEKYFMPKIISILKENETFVNIGAYEGEFTNKFIKTVNNKFNAIYAFEPDNKNVNSFLNNVFSNISINNINIHLIPKALGNPKMLRAEERKSISKENAEKKRFCNGLKCMSQFSEIGQDDVAVYKLDDFNLSPTIIKIHVEGLESDIFDGGIETITKNRPIIMMTTYHNRKGLWEIPLHAIDSLINYIYYFRLHLWGGTCGIIYAVPKERLK